ncbi:type II toxin-antitoxin system RelE/ParE family toxin [Ectothiorhodospiraceae bacterium BW-2]|nr:type II toxin-antitoxin system RelE/ParE family toxin [Ectothiorhodospiraceae bacterium BW-2]
MYTIKQTPEFIRWFTTIKDGMTRRRLATRLRKASLGNLGDTKPLGEGLFEMREFFGPGWRLYYTIRNGVMVIMIGGGDKSSQISDIAKAKALLRQLED